MGKFLAGMLLTIALPKDHHQQRPFLQRLLVQGGELDSLIYLSAADMQASAQAGSMRWSPNSTPT